eukprot:4418209-Amphidinium_carterae.1
MRVLLKLPFRLELPPARHHAFLSLASGVVQADGNAVHAFSSDQLLWTSLPPFGDYPKISVVAHRATHPAGR